MKQFTSVLDVPDLQSLLSDAVEFRRNPGAYSQLGKGKTLGLVFLNPSLRTRLSSQKAALNLGMECVVMNAGQEGWALEFADVPMNGTTVEHIKEAAGVMGRYFDILGVRCFPGLSDREKDYSEMVLEGFIRYSGIPVISLESATRHPLQSLADLLTIETQKKTARPKVVLAWAPHVKPLPQAVPNSFAEWMNAAEVDFTIAHPPGYALHEKFVGDAHITDSLNDAISDADFIYVKNWSAYEPYGAMSPVKGNWLLTADRLRQNLNAKVMHCLPVRRDLELAADVLDGSQSVVLDQAENRMYAAQAVLKQILENG